MSSTLGDIFIWGGRAVLPDEVRPASIEVRAGRIVDINVQPDEQIDKQVDIPPGDRPGVQQIDARGLTILPGLIDAHVHFNEPGRTAWEGIATGTAALAAGGGTCFVDMPLNSDPPLLDARAFAAKQAAAAEHSRTDYAFYGGLTPRNLGSLVELAECGVVGYKAFMCPSGIDEFPHSLADTLVQGMETAAQLGLPVLLHAESPAVLAKVKVATAAGAGYEVERFLESRPVQAELEAVGQALECAKATGCRVHLVHLSSAQAVELVRRAAAQGVQASCETCPHYLFFNRNTVLEQGAWAKCAPPLRNEQMRLELLERLLAGDIDTVGSDHSPCPPELKEAVPFSTAWGGIAGVQTTIRALLTLNVPLPLIARLTAAGPAALLRLPNKGSLTVGNDADLTLLRPKAASPLTAAELRHRHPRSPYIGHTLRGSIEASYLRGCRITAQTRGRLLRPAE